MIQAFTDCADQVTVFCGLRSFWVWSCLLLHLPEMAVWNQYCAHHNDRSVCGPPRGKHTLFIFTEKHLVLHFPFSMEQTPHLKSCISLKCTLWNELFKINSPIKRFFSAEG